MIKLIVALLIYLSLRVAWSAIKGFFFRKSAPRNEYSPSGQNRYDLQGKDVSDADFEEV